MSKQSQYKVVKQPGNELYKWAVFMDDAYVTCTETKQQANEAVRMMKVAEQAQAQNQMRW